tara:strand:- start:1780 stop:2223 length:444 start_codon:yes stop_codon:yes gene_type:complete
MGQGILIPLSLSGYPCAVPRWLLTVIAAPLALRGNPNAATHPETRRSPELDAASLPTREISLAGSLPLQQEIPMKHAIPLYDALRDINVSADKARAVVDALEDDMRDLATKQDLKELEQRLSQALTIRLGGMLVAAVAFLSAIKFFA